MKGKMFEEMDRGADISECGTYRYRLWRFWGDGKVVLWIMLNPSTADGEQDDPTIRRCIGFTQRWGFPGMMVVNLFALRATNPKELLDHPDPAGPDNAQFIHEEAKAAGLIVAAWGSNKMAQEGCGRATAMLRGLPVKCLGVTASGQPRHPLYVPNKQPLVELLSTAKGVSG